MLTSTRLFWMDATRGGEETTVGMKRPEADRCERVTEPSEFGQRMTMGVLTIWEPKPLRNEKMCQLWEGGGSEFNNKSTSG